MVGPPLCIVQLFPYKKCLKTKYDILGRLCALHLINKRSCCSVATKCSEQHGPKLSILKSVATIRKTFFYSCPSPRRHFPQCGEFHKVILEKHILFRSIWHLTECTIWLEFNSSKNYQICLFKNKDKWNTLHYTSEYKGQNKNNYKNTTINTSNLQHDEHDWERGHDVLSALVLLNRGELVYRERKDFLTCLWTVNTTRADEAWLTGGSSVPALGAFLMQWPTE